HNAGDLQFGPAEGDGGERYLYLSVGDGGFFFNGDPDGNAQDPGTLLGSLLRLDVNGGGLPLDCGAGTGIATVPPDNPGVGLAGACDEMYAYGFRNPWRFSFGPDGRLWLGDVGQFTWEELDLVEAGGNYGWNEYEGNACYDPPCDPTGKVFPIVTYRHEFTTNGAFAIIGGYVYTGNNCASQLGRYVYGDYVTGNVWSLTYDGTTVDNRLLAGLGGRLIRSFGRDEQGEVYLANAGFGGDILTLDCVQPVRVEAAPVGGPVVVGPGGGTFDLDVALTNASGATQTVSAWADADLSTGAELAAVLGPVAVTLPPGVSVTRRVTVRVPAAAPAGTSTLVVKVGQYPDVPVSGARFTVTKQPAEAVASGPTVWGSEGFAFAGGDRAGAALQVDAPEATASPNPFRGTATITFAVPAAADVRLAVYDVLGREVAVLADGRVEAGTHAVPFDAGDLPAGTYVWRLVVGADVQTGRMTQIR
ncbi:MAG: PQQ-dependent sugar dehydrogenase, partial [Rubricoccaceae bacterium]|nr:PQQ-dependent sugar dehydrogenase [Rubricoccaceae bacterium]